MKIILEFDHGEEDIADQAYKGPRYAQASEDFRNLLRSKIKHADLSEEETKVYEHIWDMYHVTFEGLID